MIKRKFDAKLRKVGNSFVITIPRDTINRFKLKQGSFLTIDLNFSDLKKSNQKRKNKGEIK